MTIALHQHRPILVTDAGRRVPNWPWWLKRVPMALLAIPSAYGVGAFVESADVPVAVAVIAGGAFEAAYLGAIAMADQQHQDEDGWTTALWWLVNLAAVLASVLSNLLFFSGGTYAGITPEVATHAIPLPVLGFFYGLLLHRTSAQAAARAVADAEAEAAKVSCRYCGVECKNQAAEYSHFRTCPKHPSRQAAARAVADAEAEAAKVSCRYCGVECKNQAAEYSHFRTCPKHPSRQPPD